MDWNSAIIGLVVGGAIVALGIKFFPTIAKEEQGYPFEKQIEAALLPYIFNAIASGYRMSERAVDDIEQRIEGLDKAVIARKVYDMLPDKIAGHDISTIKGLIGEDRFSELIQGVFNDFDQFFDAHKERFNELYEEWKEENTPS